MFRIGLRTVVYRGGKRSIDGVHGTIWRMESLYVVEVVRYSAHLDHAIPVIRCEALDLRTSVLC